MVMKSLAVDSVVTYSKPRQLDSGWMVIDSHSYTIRVLESGPVVWKTGYDRRRKKLPYWLVAECSGVRWHDAARTAMEELCGWATQSNIKHELKHTKFYFATEEDRTLALLSAT